MRQPDGYEALLHRLYGGVGRRVAEIRVPSIRALAVTGNEPPGSRQFQDAVAMLFGVAYTLRMGLKHGKIRPPKGYHDYRVGALEALWWSTDSTLEIANARTLRWQAYLMVPPFISKSLVNEARTLARAKHPELSYDDVELVTLREGRAVQTLHVGPYDREAPTVERLEQYAVERGLHLAGKHHEIYLGDPRRTRPERLRTIIRRPVRRRLA